jgi:hypothetical protein
MLLCAFTDNFLLVPAVLHPFPMSSGDRDKRMHLLASMLCELLREMKNQGSLRDVGEAGEWACRAAAAACCSLPLGCGHDDSYLTPHHLLAA